MSRTIGNLPTSYQVSMSYEEQIEEILHKYQEMLDNINEIITNYNIIIEEYNNILEEYNTIISEFTEINDKIDTNTSNIGTLSSLNTTEKSNLVVAINEANSKVDLVDTVKNFLAGYNPTNNTIYYRTENKDGSATQFGALNGTDLVVQKRVGSTWSNLFRFSDTMKDYIITDKFNICNDKSFPAGTSPSTTVSNVPQKTGYKAINVRLENSRSGDLNLWYMLLSDDGTTVSWRAKNITSSDLTSTITVVVTYVKSFN